MPASSMIERITNNLNVKDITIGILAGGRSRRMGQDKALLKIGDETFLERTVRIGNATRLPIIVIGREKPDNFSESNAVFLRDRFPGTGPLGGLVTGLHHTRSALLLLPCDMPFLTTEALVWLARTAGKYLETQSLHGIVVRNNKRIEPLFSVYFHPMLAKAEHQILQTGNLGLRNCIAGGNFVALDLPQEHAGALKNVNTPADLPPT